MLKEKPYDLAIIYNAGVLRHNDLPSFLTDEDHAQLFPGDVAVADLIKWGLKSGLRADVWEEGNCIYALGNTEHLLWIAENIYYPLRVELPNTAEHTGDFIGGHVVNPSKFAPPREAAGSAPSLARSRHAEFAQAVQYLPPNAALPPVYLGYSSRLRWKKPGAPLPWKLYKIPQDSQSILREVDRSRLCYHGLSEYLNLYNLLNGDLATSACQQAKGTSQHRKFKYSVNEATTAEEFEPCLEALNATPPLSARANYLKPTTKVIRSIHLYKNQAAYNRLAAEWANWRCIWKYEQPFELIRDYLGDEICIYFHFLQTCIRWLSFAAAIGLVATVVNYQSTFVHHSRKFTFTRIVMSVTMSVTAGVIYQKWLTLQTELKANYGIASYEYGLTQRVPLPTFQFTKVALDPVNPSHKIPVADACAQRMRYGFSLAVTTVAVVVAAIFVNDDLHEYLFAKYEVRSWLEQRLQAGLQAVLSLPLSEKIPVDKIPTRPILTSIIAAVFNGLYKALCGSLTIMENHRFPEAHEYSMIRKLFLFSAFDYLLPLYSLAFVKVHYDPCWDEDPDYGRCLISLITQMKSIISMALLGNLLELGTPFVTKALKQWRLKKKAEASNQRSVQNPQVMEEMSRGEYTSTSNDFGEVMLILMIGCLFSAAWFCLPALVLIILYIEVRVDAVKILCLNMRPYPSTGLNMTSWNFILDSLMNLTIITNVSVIAFTSFGGELPINVKLGLCFIGIVTCVTAKEAVTSCGCREELTVSPSRPSILSPRSPISRALSGK